MEKSDNRWAIKWLLDFWSWEEINFVETNKWEVRGWHYHKYTDEAFYIVEWLIRVLIKNINDWEEKEFIFKAWDLFMIQPWELHTFYVKEDAKWINILSKKMDENNPDFYK